MAGDPRAISMTVLRDGYWAGSYARPGDLITVEAEWIEALEVAGFAQRRAPEAPRETAGRTKWPVTRST